MFRSTSINENGLAFIDTESKSSSEIKSIDRPEFQKKWSKKSSRYEDDLNVPVHHKQHHHKVHSNAKDRTNNEYRQPQELQSGESMTSLRSTKGSHETRIQVSCVRFVKNCSNGTCLFILVLQTIHFLYFRVLILKLDYFQMEMCNTKIKWNLDVVFCIRFLKLQNRAGVTMSIISNNKCSEFLHFSLYFSINKKRFVRQRTKDDSN